MNENRFCTNCGAKREADEAYCKQCGAPFAQPAPAQPPLYGPGSPVVTAPPQAKKTPGWVIGLIIALVVCFVVVPIIAGTIIGVVFVRNIPAIVDSVEDFAEDNDYFDNMPSEWYAPFSALYDTVYLADDFAAALPGVRAADLASGKTYFALTSKATVFVAADGTKRILAEYYYDFNAEEGTLKFYADRNTWLNEETVLADFIVTELLPDGVLRISPTNDRSKVFDLTPDYAAEDFVYDAAKDAFVFTSSGVG